MRDHLQDIRSPCIRDRHWTQLAAVTHVAVEIGPECRLNDVLLMNLHKHVSEVQDVIEVATKELKIEEKLVAVEEYWASARLSVIDVGFDGTPLHLTSPASKSVCKIIQVPASLLDELDDHMMSLQMASSMGRYADFFKDRITLCQQLLFTTESVLRSWLSVQKRWLALVGTLHELPRCVSFHTVCVCWPETDLFRLR